MKREEVLKFADITSDGSIMMGHNVVVDGYIYGRKIAIFTHIHRDHEEHLTAAMHNCRPIYVSKPTLDLLAALRGQNSVKGRHIFALDYDSPVVPEINNTQKDAITLKQAKHILGSSQVLIEVKERKRIVYTSDFNYPETEPIPCDVLVIDSTHGDPMFNSIVDHESLERRLVDAVKESIFEKKPVVIRAHRGRLQYTMHLLSKVMPDDIDFLTSATDLKLLPVYEKYGMPIRKSFDYDTYEGEQIEEGNWPFIEFRTFGSGNTYLESIGKMTKIFLGGYQFSCGNTIVKHSDGSWHLEFSDHANFKGILDYVKKANPEWVVVDNVRSKMGKTLADLIFTKTGINTVARPELLPDQS